MKNVKQMGRLQREMYDFISVMSDLGQKLHIQSDSDSRRIVESLEKRHLVKVNRSFQCWGLTKL
jgi:hypothetical protein